VELEEFISLSVRGSEGKTFGNEEVDPLIRKARGRIDSSKLPETCCGVPRFFSQLPRGTGFRSFAWIEPACGNLIDVPICSIPILSYQKNSRIRPIRSSSSA